MPFRATDGRKVNTRNHGRFYGQRVSGGHLGKLGNGFLIKAVHEQYRIPTQQVRKVLFYLTWAIQAALLKGQEVHIERLGKWRFQRRTGRTNRVTGEKSQDRLYVKFEPATALRLAVQKLPLDIVRRDIVLPEDLVLTDGLKHDGQAMPQS